MIENYGNVAKFCRKLFTVPRHLPTLGTQKVCNQLTITYNLKPSGFGIQCDKQTDYYNLWLPTRASGNYMPQVITWISFIVWAGMSVQIFPNKNGY